MAVWVERGLLLFAALSLITGLACVWILFRRALKQCERMQTPPPSLKSTQKPLLLPDLATVLTPEAASMVFEPERGVLALWVLPEAGASFMGYDLLQALLSVGVQQGEGQRFYRYGYQTTGMHVLFEVRVFSDTEQTLSSMGAVSATKLRFSLVLQAHMDASMGFEQMLAAARQLTELLSGQLLTDAGLPFDDASPAEYMHRLQTFEDIDVDSKRD